MGEKYTLIPRIRKEQLMKDDQEKDGQENQTFTGYTVSESDNVKQLSNGEQEVNSKRNKHYSELRITYPFSSQQCCREPDCPCPEGYDTQKKKKKKVETDGVTSSNSILYRFVYFCANTFGKKNLSLFPISYKSLASV